jgi:hypothetical protein
LERRKQKRKGAIYFWKYNAFNPMHILGSVEVLYSHKDKSYWFWSLFLMRVEEYYLFTMKFTFTSPPNPKEEDEEDKYYNKIVSLFVQWGP